MEQTIVFSTPVISVDFWLVTAMDRALFLGHVGGFLIHFVFLGLFAAYGAKHVQFIVSSTEIIILGA